MHTSSQATVIVENVTHRYTKDKNALNDISFELRSGLFGLLGANGAGKSTLMRILSALQVPSSGRVCVGGYDIVTERKQARASLGYLPQTFGGWPHYTVEQTLDFLARLSGLDDKNSRASRIKEVVDAVGLNAAKNKKSKHLSGGMLRRLGIAQAIIHRPPVVIMDEPTVGLDPEERLRFRQLIAELSETSVVILSTHIIADLSASCEKLALIYEGHLEFIGAPGELINQAAGDVVEVVCSSDQLQSLDEGDDLEVVSRLFDGSASILRGVVSQGRSIANSAAAENITLEEAYLAFSMSKGLKAVKN